MIIIMNRETDIPYQLLGSRSDVDYDEHAITFRRHDFHMSSSINVAMHPPQTVFNRNSMFSGDYYEILFIKPISTNTKGRG